MFAGVGLVIGGGVTVVLGRLVNAVSDTVRADSEVVRASLPFESLPAEPLAAGTTAYVQFTGRLAPVNQSLFKSAISRRLEATEADAIRVRSTTFQVTEEAARDGILVQSENKVASSEVGGDVAVVAHDGGRRVVLRHGRYFSMLYRAGEDSFEPAKDTNISVFGDGDQRRKTIGYRTAEATIPKNHVVSGVGIVESALVYGESGAPALAWTLAPPSHRHLQGRPSFVVYGGPDALILEQERIADTLGSIGTMLTVVGLAAVFGGCYFALTKQTSGRK
ncbi:hypothetical protein ACHHYP_03413 [Achlya hypogyna]|uniref:Uncharacterized protein n=1 Tax=Achlya hypogyna TaxID=1202772 RepID=A0A1V9ZRB8_ACHHY|nr:hypothetical protein ACHHYP_03413 [Achlya hypogyna]